MAAAGQSSITVAIRVRPFTIREAAQLQKNDDSTLFLGDGSLASAPPKLHQRGLRNVIKVVDDRCLVFDPPEDNPVHKFSRSVVPTSKRVKDQVFAFDRVFDDNTTQTDVYEGTTKNLLDSVLDGYNATVFAYGATGCGKTHTITGTAQHPGIIFLTMQELFEKIEERSQDKTTELSLSYLEIYNETIRDLLVPGGSKQGLTLREDSNQAVTVAGLSSHHPRDVQQVMDMIVQGNEYRTVSPTEANATSSRSHAVLQVNIAQKDRNADVNEPHTMATLSIIDLAGSERASVTKNRGERLAEGANINKSLLALGSCINALCDRRQRAHVPYRNSKLTRLLKFSLGGNCKTVMIVCVSPSSAHFDETQNTLRYANRAKNIQTKVTRNVFNVNRHVKDFLVKIDEQMALIKELKAQQNEAEAMFLAKLRKQCDKRDCVVVEGVQRLRAAYEHTAGERQERVVSMKKLRAVERRISLLSGWMGAFDAVCDGRAGLSDSEDGAMPKSLAAIRGTAKGILAELENSRQHLHQRLDKTSWERAIDTALTHSLKQLEGVEGAEDPGNAASGLEREAELLKTGFGREAYREVLESEKGSDAAVVQMLLTAQLDILASLTDLMAMDEQSAVAHAKQCLGRLLQTGHDAAVQVVKPDVSSVPLPVVEAFPPTRKGTPKRKKTASYACVGPVAPTVHNEHVFGSPIKSLSPRRRRVLGAASHLKKGVCFSPVRRVKGRGVRWRDDETEQGTLADYGGTPRRWESPIKGCMSPDKSMGGGVSRVSTNEPRQADGKSSPSTEVPAKAGGRFQAGFLSKSSRASSGSPQLQSPPKLDLRLATSSPDLKGSPLRMRSGGSPLAVIMDQPNRRLVHETGAPKQADGGRINDENTAPQQPRWPRQATPDGSSDSETIDARKVRSALQNMSKLSGRRSSGMSLAMAAKRAPSSSSGVTRLRRASPPPMPCASAAPSPMDHAGLTAGQARRMKIGGSVRLAESPRDEARRVTVGTGPRRTVAWR